MFRITKSSLVSAVALTIVGFAMLGCESESATTTSPEQPVTVNPPTAETVSETKVAQEPLTINARTVEPDAETVGETKVTQEPLNIEARTVEPHDEESSVEESDLQDTNPDESEDVSVDPESPMEDAEDVEDHSWQVEIDEDTVWLEIFDQLSASEQSCIEGISGIEDLDDRLGRGLMALLDEEAAEDDLAEDIPIFQCLDQESANEILTQIMLIGTLEDTDDEVVVSCLRDALDSVDIRHFMLPQPEMDEEALVLAAFMVASTLDLCWKLPPAIELDAPQGETVWKIPAELQKLSGVIFLDLVSEDVIYGLDRTTPHKSVIAIDRLNGEVLWRYDFRTRSSWDRDPYIFSMVDGVIYASNNNLHAIDASSGRLLWDHLDGGHPENLVVADGVVYYLRENFDRLKTLFAADALTGEALWVYRDYPFSDNQSFAIGGGVVYVGRIVVLDSLTGQRISFDDEPLWHDSRRWFGINDRKIVDGAVYWLYESGLEVVEALTWEDMWQYDAELARDTKAQIAEGRAYLWSRNEGTISAIDLDDGVLLWTFESEGTNAGFTIANGIVYSASQSYSSDENRESGHAYALDATTGELLWEFETTNAPLFHVPTVDEGVVYVGGKGLYALDATDGDLLWYYLIDLTENNAPLVKDGTVYVADLWRGVYGLKAPQSE